MIENTYHRLLKVTGNETAAAVLVLAEIVAGQQGPLTPQQAAEKLGVSPTTIYDACKRGALRHQRIGKAIRINAGDLADFSDAA